jgi:hypothetical protein
MRNIFHLNLSKHQKQKFEPPVECHRQTAGFNKAKAARELKYRDCLIAVFFGWRLIGDAKRRAIGN